MRVGLTSTKFVFSLENYFFSKSFLNLLNFKNGSGSKFYTREWYRGVWRPKIQNGQGHRDDRAKNSAKKVKDLKAPSDLHATLASLAVAARLLSRLTALPPHLAGLVAGLLRLSVLLVVLLCGQHKTA